ncbi:MAG TPA: FAD-binding oxidoreductase, partial [Gemmatimonadales bacterium]|nr:FAD-binding oxidoreductase [Gemmatimonadales bacterium]
MSEVAALERELRATLQGEVRFDAGSRAAYSTDSSNYRQVPLGVVLPRSADEVVKTVALCRKYAAPLTSRGGGTSLAGQTCNVAVILDHSKYFNAVLEVDAGRRLARVEPGCNLDALRKSALERAGLTFGPDPATHDRNTLGGMIGNNSCGVHSVMAEFYGPGPLTRHQVLQLEVLTYDGLRFTVGPTSDAELEGIIAAGGRRGAIYAGMRSLRDRYAEEIRRRYPDIPRRVSGYNLDALLPEHGFNVAHALVGTEGTCVVVLGATLALIDPKPERALLVLGYPDVFSAGDHVPEILEHRPIGLEGLDEEMIFGMRKKHLHEENLGLLPEGKGWLLVEFGAETRAEASAQARRLMGELQRGHAAPQVKLFEDPQEAQRLWEVRESGLGATALVPGMRVTHEGWEDAAVPPAALGSYLRGFRALLAEFDYHTALYGHFGQGCIHCRIDFDLATDPGIQK